MGCVNVFSAESRGVDLVRTKDVLLVKNTNNGGISTTLLT